MNTGKVLLLLVTLMTSFIVCAGRADIWPSIPFSCPNGRGNIVLKMNGVKEKGWEKFGFKEGDSIIKINGKEICNSTNITPMFIEAINNKGTITIGRKGEGNPIKIHFPSFKK